MRPLFAVGLAVLVATIFGAQARTASLDSSVLALDTSINMQFHEVECPANTPAVITCITGTANPAAPVPGLGATVPRFESRVDRSDPALRCTSWTVRGSFEVAGNGAFTFAGTSEGCQPFEAGGRTRVPLTISGGDGRFAGASGSGLLDFSLRFGSTPVRVTGTLTVPGYSFDLTAPTISAQDKTVTARRGVRAVRVRYRVTATDDVDGHVAVVCKPESGSLFKPGHTTVNCSATDSSANEATASFTITVKRRARH